MYLHAFSKERRHGVAKYYTRASWEKFKGKTDWKGGAPGTGLIHTVCGQEIKEFVQARTVWGDGVPSSMRREIVEIGILACVKCDGEPRRIAYGHPINPSDFFDPTKTPTRSSA